MSVYWILGTKQIGGHTRRPYAPCTHAPSIPHAPSMPKTKERNPHPAPHAPSTYPPRRRRRRNENIFHHPAPQKSRMRQSRSNLTELRLWVFEAGIVKFSVFERLYKAIERLLEGLHRGSPGGITPVCKLASPVVEGKDQSEVLCVFLD